MKLRRVTLLVVLLAVSWRAPAIGPPAALAAPVLRESSHSKPLPPGSLIERPPGELSELRPQAELIARGEELFRTDLTPAQGLGPLYNARSCTGCHSSPTVGGTGNDGLGIVARVGRVADGAVDPLVGRGGPTARAHSVAELGHPCGLSSGIPPDANVVSLRNAPALFGVGLIDAISHETILAGAVPRGDGVHGRANVVRDSDGRERLGRFGWKAETPGLELFVAEALRNEHGITNPLAPQDLTPAVRDAEAPCAGQSAGLEDDGALLASLTAYVRSLDPPPSPPQGSNAAGESVFLSIGCGACHTPSLPSGSDEARLYSDLLVHDLGSALNDGLSQGQAGGSDWRTAPLWGLGSRTRYLHDGRARSLHAAILAHGGEARTSINRFRRLAPAERDALQTFLASL
jgi:CxxC motif-containing protein (DUF1111 family)